MAASRHDARLTPSSDAFRLVIGGFPTSRRLWAAHAELGRLGLGQDQLCVFGLDEALGPRAERPRSPASCMRTAAGLKLKVYAAMLFDDVGLTEVSAADDGPEWMPMSQAEILWKHVRQGTSVLLVKTVSPDQQVTSSQIQLGHQPAFVHTFNFSR